MSRQYKEWSKEEIEKLIAMWPTYKIVEIAKKLGRTPKSIASKAQSLKLRVSDKKVKEDYSWGVHYSEAFWWTPYTDKDKEFIKANYKTMTLKQMALALGRKPYGIAYQMQVLGLKKGRGRPKKKKTLIPEYINEDRFYYNYQAIHFFSKHEGIIDYIFNFKYEGQ